MRPWSPLAPVWPRHLVGLDHPELKDRMRSWFIFLLLMVLSFGTLAWLIRFVDGDPSACVLVNCNN